MPAPASSCSAPSSALSPWTIAEALVATAGLFLLVLGVVFRSRRRVVIAATRALLGAEGEALSWRRQHGRIVIKGETYMTRRVHRGKPLPSIANEADGRSAGESVGCRCC